MEREIQPARRVAGTISLPGDKSISHRYALLAALAEGRSTIANYAGGADCASTLGLPWGAGRALQARRRGGHDRRRRLEGLRPAAAALDAGNSGTTMRLLSGILAGQPFETAIGGDASLSRRPMQRIIRPLERMGATIRAREGGLPPLAVRGGALRPIRYELPVRVRKSRRRCCSRACSPTAVTTAVEPLPTRNHSEIALRQFGAAVTVEGNAVAVSGKPRLQAQTLRAPADSRRLRFFLPPLLCCPNRTCASRASDSIRRAPPCSTFCNGWAAASRPAAMRPRGRRAALSRCRAAGGCSAARSRARSRPRRSTNCRCWRYWGRFPARDSASATRPSCASRKATASRRRPRTCAAWACGVTTSADGMDIAGNSRLRGAALDSFGDHRIAMAFTVAALAAEGPSRMANAEAAAVSFPEFYGLLDRLTA